MYQYKVYDLSSMIFVGESDSLTVIKLLKDEYLLRNKKPYSYTNFGVFEYDKHTNKYLLIK